MVRSRTSSSSSSSSSSSTSRSPNRRTVSDGHTLSATATANLSMSHESASISRPSSYHKKYEIEMSKYEISGDVKLMKEGEREQLKTLNNSLVNYINKVHDLEIMVKKLCVENAKLSKKCKKGSPEVDIRAIYEAELRALRVKIENLQSVNVELSIDRDNKTFDYEQTLVKYVEEKDKVVIYSKEVDVLRKDVDEATVERTKMEGKIESLKGKIDLERKVHEAEMQNLRDQVHPVESRPTFADNFEPKPSLLPDLSEAIANVRKEYEAFNARSLEDLDKFYKEKVETLNLQVKALTVEIREVKGDNAIKRREISRIKLGIDALKQKKTAMEKLIAELEERLRAQDKEKEDEVAAMRLQLAGAKQDLGKYLKQYQELNALKLSLDQEISIYKKLITGEAVRIADVDTSVVETRSRSSSRSSSSIISRSSSSSSSSSSSDEEISSSSDVNEMGITETERKLRIERNKTRREVRVRLKVQKQQRRQEKSERKQAKIEREKLYAEIVKKGKLQ